MHQVLIRRAFLCSPADYEQVHGADSTGTWIAWKLIGTAMRDVGNPARRFEAHSHLDLTRQGRLDLGLHIPIPQHVRVDARLGLRSAEHLELPGRPELEVLAWFAIVS